MPLPNINPCARGKRQGQSCEKVPKNPPETFPIAVVNRRPKHFLRNRDKKTRKRRGRKRENERVREGKSSEIAIAKSPSEKRNVCAPNKTEKGDGVINTLEKKRHQHFLVRLPSATVG